ncbi:hypothetical protein CC79DRAFT_1318828 [Sarocladium strictum]
MATGSQATTSVEDYRVAMIFAMGFEMSAFRYMLDEEHEMTFDKEPGDQNQYILGKSGRHNVVLACLPGEQGKGAAAMAAKDLGRTFQAVEWRLLVGIGGGVPSPRHDIRLGDVVVSMPHMEHGGVVQYDLGRATDGRYQLKGFLHPPPAYLRNVVGQMESNHLAQGDMIDRFVSLLQERGPRIHQQYQRPPPESDVLFRDDVPHNAESASCEGCDASGFVARPQRPADEMTEIHYGLIASGDTVVASTTARQEIIADLGDPDVLCFEMEAAGIMSGYECLVIRGISDYADSHKCRHWRHYAAAAAAACAKELLILARPTAATTARELPTSGESAGRGGASASDGGDRGRIQGGNYNVHQGVLGANGSTISTGNLHFRYFCKLGAAESPLSSSFLGLQRPACPGQTRSPGEQPQHDQYRGHSLPQSYDDGADQTRQPTLRDLLSFPEMQGRERRVEIAHDGTCEWFVHTQEYSTWTENPRNDWRDNIIWVRGNAGAGKSTLMKFAVEHAREATPDKLILPHFFNARGQALEHSIGGMWRTLIVWLLDELPEAVVQQLSSPYRRYFSKEWDVPELERLLNKAVRKVTGRPITFYIDALDECGVQDVDRLLWVFCDIVKKAHESGQQIRVCLASRPYPAITFTNAIFLNFHEQDEHLADIDHYIEDRLQIGISEVAITIQWDIRRKAKGIFMWVVLVVNLLNTDFRNGSIQTLQDRLMEIPDDLRSFFIYTLERYPEDRPAMLVCFRWLLFARGWCLDQPRLWWGMQLGLGKPDHEIVEEYEKLDYYDMERQLVSKTKGFIEFKTGEVEFVHESIREFILNESTLLGAEHPSEFEVASHELLRDWWSAEVLACQPIVRGLLPHCHQAGEIAYDNEACEVLRTRPLGLIAAYAAVSSAEDAQNRGRDQDVWLNRFSQMAGPYIVSDDEEVCLILGDMMSLLLFAKCEILVHDTQLEPTRRGRRDGRALGFKDTAYEGVCPALQACYLIDTDFSAALLNIYLDLEPRSRRLQGLVEEEITDRLIRHYFGPAYFVPLLDLANRNEGLATFFLLALTPPDTLEPYLDILELMFKTDDLPHLVWVLHLIIEQQLPTDAIDCMSPSLLEWIEIEEEVVSASGLPGIIAQVPLYNAKGK